MRAMEQVGWVVTLALALGSGCDKKDERPKGDPDKASSSKASAAASPTSSGASTAAASAAPPAVSASAVAAPPAPAAGGVSLAAAHLPGDCDVAVAINLGSVVAQPDFAREVVPQLEAIAKKSDSKDEKFQRFQTALAELGLDVKRSLKTAAVCVKLGDGEPKFAVAIGGELKPETVIAAVEKNMKADKKALVTDIDGRKAISDAAFSFGQAADGALVLSNDLALFKSMNATGDHHKAKYGLALDRSLSLAAAESLMKNPSTKKEFDKVQKASAFVDLATMKLGGRLVLTDAAEAKKLEALLGEMKKAAEKDLSKDATGGLDVLKSLVAKVDGNDVVIEGAIPEASLKKAVSQAAEGLKRALSEL